MDTWITCSPRSTCNNSNIRFLNWLTTEVVKLNQRRPLTVVQKDATADRGFDDKGLPFVLPRPFG
jgi:hypothetical protein